MTLGRIVLLAALVLPSLGCGSKEFTVPEMYAPLVSIVERPNYVLPETAITTIGTTAYVVSLGDWLADHPEGSIAFNATLLHEQEHSKRQLSYGTLAWLAQYVVDTGFMWAEEQRGWYLELKALANSGQHLNVDAIAQILHDYKNLSGRMVSFPEAQIWVRDVLAGTWKPN